MYASDLLPVFGLSDLFDTLNDDVKACSSCTPRATVSEKGGIYTLEVELPGVKKSDIDVHVEGNSLSIKATRKSASAEMHYERSFKLADEINPESAEAFLENGILTFKFTRKQSAAQHKLTIK